MCIASGEDAEFNGVIDRIDQNVCAEFLCVGCDFDDQEVREDRAECAQDELSASFSRGRAIKRGVNVDRKVNNYRPTPELTLTDRRAKVNHAKRNSKCRKCDKTGHWAGDNDCQMRDQPDGKDKGKGKGTKRKAHQVQGSHRHDGTLHGREVRLDQRPLRTRYFRSDIQCLTPMLGPRTRSNLDQEHSGRDPRSRKKVSHTRSRIIPTQCVLAYTKTSTQHMW